MVIADFRTTLFSNPDVVRSATAVLLDLSFGMRARWLLRPIMVIWCRHVQGEKKERELWSRVPPPTDTVDFAAPTHVIRVQVCCLLLLCTMTV